MSSDLLRLVKVCPRQEEWILEKNFPRNFQANTGFVLYIVFWRTQNNGGWGNSGFAFSLSVVSKVCFELGLDVSLSNFRAESSLQTGQSFPERVRALVPSMDSRRMAA